MRRIFRRILLILSPFACIKLGYIYAQHDIAYVTLCDRIRRENIRFFDRIDPSTIGSTYGAGRIIGFFCCFLPFRLPASASRSGEAGGDEGEKKQSRLLIGGKKNEPDPLHCLVSGSVSLPFPMLVNEAQLVAR